MGGLQATMNPQQLPAERQQHVRFEGHVTDELLKT